MEEKLNNILNNISYRNIYNVLTGLTDLKVSCTEDSYENGTEMCISFSDIHASVNHVSKLLNSISLKELSESNQIQAYKIIENNLIEIKERLENGKV